MGIDCGWSIARASVITVAMRTLESGVKILLVLPRMVSGGVERVTLNLIEQFTKDGIECRLALRHCRGELLSEQPRPALNKVDAERQQCAKYHR